MLIVPAAEVMLVSSALSHCPADRKADLRIALAAAAGVYVTFRHREARRALPRAVCSGNWSVRRIESLIFRHVPFVVLGSQNVSTVDEHPFDEVVIF